MELLVLILTLSPWIAVGTSGNTEPEPLENSTDVNKDMYVIHAMVYQVGILTNKTDDEIYSNSTGNQEALTLYHTNGSNIDLSNIPSPLLTNITAQRLVGVAPTLEVGNGSVDKSSLPWTTFDHLAPLQAANAVNPEKTRLTRELSSDTDDVQENYTDDEDFDSNNRPTFMEKQIKRYRTMKRDVTELEKTPVKVVKGSAIIPEEAGVQSIGIPSLITLNNNFSEIPVPIPNTSIVRYSKINTLVHAP